MSERQLDRDADPMQSDQVDDPRVLRVRTAMEDHGWSQRTLADKSLTGESTIFRLLRGQYTRKTLIKVQRALGLDDLPRLGDVDASANRETGNPAVSPHQTPGIASTRLGGYSRDLFAHYVGAYRFVRATFQQSDDVMVYPMEIYWSDEEPGLMFDDANPGYEQSGCILVASGTPLIHFTTLDRGSARLLTAYHMPPGRRFIRGIVLTIANPRGRELYPAVAPVVMQKLTEEEAISSAITGPMPQSHPDLKEAVEALNTMQFPSALLRG